MTLQIPDSALQLQSLIRDAGELEISLAEVRVSKPGADEVLVRVEMQPVDREVDVIGPKMEDAARVSGGEG